MTVVSALFLNSFTWLTVVCFDCYFSAEWYLLIIVIMKLTRGFWEFIHPPVPRGLHVVSYSFDSRPRRPSSSRCSSSWSSLPSPEPPPRWPVQYRWWRARWQSRPHTAGCPPRPARRRPAAAAPGTSRFGSRRRGGGGRAGSCWRRGAGRSRSSTGCLAAQQQRFRRTGSECADP